LASRPGRRRRPPPFPCRTRPRRRIRRRC
jgi:hypothetical protein